MQMLHSYYSCSFGRDILMVINFQDAWKNFDGFSTDMNTKFVLRWVSAVFRVSERGNLMAFSKGNNRFTLGLRRFLDGLLLFGSRCVEIRWFESLNWNFGKLIYSFRNFGRVLFNNYKRGLRLVAALLVTFDANFVNEFNDKV
ncbi:hypothetical protein RCL_jg4257.t2 [Rhizophagus clarus]|uniref:Uncharacterized protein n=1 Tax=Rhizophagus clarus TaxID=94130 RepID=A0A8H3KTN9_9GLOM|nr:hypothetical protein RCL_jg4257.t2 [Rhizophagus clarus]